MQLLISFLIVISQLFLRSSVRLLAYLWGLIQLLFYQPILIFLWKYVDVQYKKEWREKLREKLLKFLGSLMI